MPGRIVLLPAQSSAWLPRVVAVVWLLVVAALIGLGWEATAVEFGIDDTRFTLDGKPAFLLGISYYGALGAPREFIERDLDDLQRYGFNWLRVWATWNFNGNDVSAVDREGNPREPFVNQLHWLVAECDRRGIVVDVTLTRGNKNMGAGKLPTLAAHLHAVETLVTGLKDHRNWYLDLANERNVRDGRFVSFEELRQLVELTRQLDPQRLVTASDGGDISKTDLHEYLSNVQINFICPHRERHADSPERTESRSQEYQAWMNELGHVVPLHYQEPFRRGYGPQHWEPSTADFIKDLRGALAGDAAGWCFHNGDQKDKPGGKPSRSFDLRQQRLFEQLDGEEKAFLIALAQVMQRQNTGGKP